MVSEVWKADCAQMCCKVLDDWWQLFQLQRPAYLLPLKDYLNRYVAKSVRVSQS